MDASIQNRDFATILVSAGPAAWLWSENLARLAGWRQQLSQEMKKVWYSG
jgi:hypothetical protein